MASNLSKIIVLDGFNNYYNRRVLWHDTYEGYESHSNFYYTFTDINFNPNDNVTAELVVRDISANPDYLLVLDDEDNIVSRWFVLRSTRTRAGQYLLQLRRDVIVDHLNSLSTAPIFVEKGMLPDSDSFVLNDEGMNLNQIKTSETLLRDITKSAWIVGYYDKKSTGDVSIQDDSSQIVSSYTPAQIAQDLGLTEVQLVSLFNLDNAFSYPAHFNTKIEFRFEYAQTAIGGGYFAYKIFTDSNIANPNYQSVVVLLGNGKPLVNGVSASTPAVMNNIYNALHLDASDVKNELGTAFNRLYLTNAQLEKLRKYVGSYIYYNSKYYVLRLSEQGTATNSTGWITASTYANIYQAVATGVSNTQGCTLKSDGYIDLIGTSDEIYIMLDYVSDSDIIPQLNASLKSGRTKVNDQEFDIFVMPYNDVKIYGRDSNNQQIIFTSRGEYCRRIASAIALSEGAKLYDIQLLPYCPFADYWWELNKALYIENLTLDKDYSYITYEDEGIVTNVGVVLWCSSNKFKLNINHRISLSTNKKVDVICDMHRLLSPNYQGTFEFNVAKNGGSVPYFIAECTMKPYTPFIKLAPYFDYLYGTNFGDHRGLICGGDFSLPRITSEWQVYQLNNKNYQNIFNRDIQNLDFKQSQEMRRALIGGGLGVAGDTMKGVATGAQLGGGLVGATVGGALGGVTSAVGLGIDIDMLAKRQREEKQLAIDKFNYQLGNVKALPYTLTKIGAFDICSKIYPVLEYFTCTQEEREAFINKIKFESMTIMRVGYVGDFIGIDSLISPEFQTADGLHYFKGLLIRNDTIVTDNNVLTAIADELQKGVFI